MTRTRIIVWLVVFLFATTPLYLLSCVTHGLRYGTLSKIYENADVALPPLAGILWYFGPLDWWSYVTPFALAVGVAARVRARISGRVSSAVVAFSVVQSVVIIGAFQPFAMLGSLMGHPLPAPYPVAPLLVNLVMLASAVGFAVMSIRRNVRV